MEPSGFRTIIINKKSKLDYHFDYINIRDENGKSSIFLSEIQLLIIESVAVSLTSYLLNELIKRKIKVIFCDEFHNPTSELNNIYGCYDVSKKIKKQITWETNKKEKLWQIIIKEKIKKQAQVLLMNGKKDISKKCMDQIKNVKIHDKTNIEGYVARLYFSNLFNNKKFNRQNDECVENSLLNYGYSILLSMFNRYIVASGYLTELGIFHCNDNNKFNLSCDLMEPFRPIVDMFICENEIKELSTTEKHNLVDYLTNKQLKIFNNKQYLTNAIQIYLRECFDFLNGSKEKENLEFYEII